MALMKWSASSSAGAAMARANAAISVFFFPSALFPSLPFPLPKPPDHTRIVDKRFIEIRQRHVAAAVVDVLVYSTVAGFLPSKQEERCSLARSDVIKSGAGITNPTHRPA
jgi:hypothetical protein